MLVSTSVTRLGDLLHFGKLFYACCNNYFALIAHIFSQFLQNFAGALVLSLWEDTHVPKVVGSNPSALY